MQEMFSKNPSFIGLNIPEIKQPETLENRYVGKMSKKAIALMAWMLDPNPKDRISAIEALSDSFFDGVWDPEVDEIVAKFK